MTTKKNIQTVCVVGAGTTGLPVVKECLGAGLQVTAFESAAGIGGRWAAASTNDGVWSEMTLNMTRRTLEFGDFAWTETTVPPQKPEYAGLFPPPAELCAYLEAYARQFDLAPHIQFNTTVKTAQVNRMNQFQWTVVTVDNKSQKETVHTFDALVVCTGLFRKPFHPCAAQLQDFTGQGLHAKDFGTTKDYQDKRVLVIGSSVSGPEIACALADGHCQTVVNSVRHAPYHITKISQTMPSKVTSEALFIRLPVWLNRYLPDSLTTPGLKATILQHCPHQLTEQVGGPPDPDIRVANVAYTGNYVHQVQQGNLFVKPAVASATGRKVTFVDGSSQDFDVIICGTGYEPDVSFLPQDVVEQVFYTHAIAKRQEAKLYKDTLVPGLPTLALVGMVSSIGPVTVLAELQARYIAAVFAELIPRPAEATMAAAVEATAKRRNTSRLGLYVTTLEVCEALGDELGLTPSKWQAMREPTKYLFRPVSACYYRSNPVGIGNTPDMATECRKRFEYYVKHPEVAKLE